MGERQAVATAGLLTLSFLVLRGLASTKRVPLSVLGRGRRARVL
jgi:hypothetical protein